MHGSAGGNAAALSGRAGALLPAQRVEERLPLRLLLGEKVAPRIRAICSGMNAHR